MPCGTHLELSSYVNESHATGIFFCQEGSLAVFKWEQLHFFLGGGEGGEGRGRRGGGMCWKLFCMFFCPICIECSSRVLLYLFRAFSRETKPTEAGCWKTWEPLSTCLCIEKDGTVLSMLIEQTSLLLMSSICSYLGTSRDWNGQKRDVLGEMQWNDGRLFLLPC